MIRPLPSGIGDHKEEFWEALGAQQRSLKMEEGDGCVERSEEVSKQ